VQGTKSPPSGAYHYLAASPAGFLQQLACYLRHGYYLYYRGHLRAGKDPLPVDGRILSRYPDILLTPKQKERRKEGAAKTQYLRHGQDFLILSTEGQSFFRSEEAKAIKDARRVPVLFAGHAISVRAGHVHVQIDRNLLKGLAALYAALAIRETKAALEARLRSLPFEPFAPVRKQCAELLRSINKRRRQADLPLVCPSCLPAGRRVCPAFGPLSPGAGSETIGA
jgi:hypothetical protein